MGGLHHSKHRRHVRPPSPRLGYGDDAKSSPNYGTDKQEGMIETDQKKTHQNIDVSASEAHLRLMS